MNIPVLSAGLGIVGQAQPQWDRVDVAVAAYFRAVLTPTSAHWLEAMTSLGAALWVFALVTGLIAVFIWRGAWKPLVTLLLTVPLGTMLGEGLKLVVHRQRPFVDGPMGVWGGYSFPSGHTIAATLVYGFLALLIARTWSRWRWRLLVLAIAFVLMSAVGFSRIALGAHYLTDVLAAMVIGMAWVCFCHFTVHGLDRRLSGGANLPSA